MFTAKNWHRVAAMTAFVCALALAGCAEKKDDAPKAEGDPTPAPPGPTPPGPTPPVPESLAKVKPDVVLTAKAARDEYEKDGLKKYEGQVVEVTGTVGDVGPYGTNGSTIYLREDNPSDFGHMHYTIRGGKAWTQAFPLQTVTLRARVATPLVWDVVDVKGSPPPTMTAETWTKELKADPDGFNTKYKRKYLIVTGVIAKVGPVELKGEYVRVWLQGAENRQMLCIFRGPKSATNLLSPQQRDSLKVDQRVKVLGHNIDEQFDVDVMLEPAP